MKEKRICKKCNEQKANVRKVPSGIVGIDVVEEWICDECYDELIKETTGPGYLAKEGKKQREGK